MCIEFLDTDRFIVLLLLRDRVRHNTMLQYKQTSQEAQPRLLSVNVDIKPVDELARVSFKRPTGPIELQQYRLFAIFTWHLASSPPLNYHIIMEYFIA